VAFYRDAAICACSRPEVEFIAASSVVLEVIFLLRLLSELGFPHKTLTPIFADNEMCIRWSQAPMVLLVAASVPSILIFTSTCFVHAASDQGILQLLKIDTKLNVLSKPFVDAFASQ
jgi:hypothetical protein